MDESRRPVETGSERNANEYDKMVDADAAHQAGMTAMDLYMHSGIPTDAGMWQPTLPATATDDYSRHRYRSAEHRLE